MGTFQDILLQRRPIQIAVDYYDSKHEQLFQAYRNSAAIRQLVGGTIAIPAAEFLTYCLFVNKRYSGIGLNTFSEIKNGLNDRLGDFNDGLALTPTSLRTIRAGDDQLAGLSEKIGVGISLSIVGRIHGLTEADWERIPRGATKSLDFKRACDDVGYVQVEAKGSSVHDNRARKACSIYQHAGEIGKQKAALRTTTQMVTAYGTIGAIDMKTDGVMQCFLLDPHGEAAPRDYKEQRILNRLFFIAELMEAVMPQSLMTMELYKRLAVLISADDMKEFDKLPLTVPHSNLETPLFLRKIHTLDKSVLGVVVPLKDGTRMFYGLRRQLIDAAYKQDFAALLGLNYESSTSPDTLMGLEFAGEGLPGASIKGQENRTQKKPRLERAVLHTTSSGRVFGLVGPEGAINVGELE